MVVIEPTNHLLDRQNVLMCAPTGNILVRNALNTIIAIQTTDTEYVIIMRVIMDNISSLSLSLSDNDDIG